MRRQQRGILRIWPYIVSLILTVIIVGVALNYNYLRDYFAGLNYRPSENMASILDALDLTDRGELIFRASQPELNERGDFNRNCRAGESDTAILGCLRAEKIYVYDITSEELDGIRELTTAHELLHAVWARMGENEKSALDDELDTVWNANQEILKAEIEIYDADEKREELFVRAGTEIRDLPTELAEKYAEIFENRAGIVGYYEKYIAVFREIEARLRELGEGTSAAKALLDEKMRDYEKKVSQFSADVVSFNACVKVAGCPMSEADFYSRRSELVNEQTELLAMYDELTGMVDEYNELVEAYNANLIHGQMINQAINSAAMPEGDL